MRRGLLTLPLQGAPPFRIGPIKRPSFLRNYDEKFFRNARRFSYLRTTLETEMKRIPKIKRTHRFFDSHRPSKNQRLVGGRGVERGVEKNLRIIHRRLGAYLSNISLEQRRAQRYFRACRIKLGKTHLASRTYV